MTSPRKTHPEAWASQPFPTPITTMSIARLHCLMAVLLITACKQQDGSASGDKNQHPTTPTSPQLTTSTSARPATAQRHASSRKKSAMDQMQRLLASADQLELSELSGQAFDLLRAHPEQASELLAHLTSTLYQTRPAEALALALQLSEFTTEGDRITSTLLQTWNDQDPKALQQHLRQLATHYGGTEFECHKALRLLLGGPEGQLHAQKWLTWLTQLPEGSDTKGELRGEVLNAMLSLIDPADPAQLQPLSAAYLERIEDQGLQKHLPELGDALARHQPQDTIALLAAIPEGLYRQDTLQRVISELSRSHPEVAAQWLSSQDVLNEIFRPSFLEWKDEAQAEGLSQEELQSAEEGFQRHIDSLFDQSMEAYILNLIDQHPQDALENVESLIDPDRRAQLRTQVQDILKAQQIAK